ncbi:peptidase C14 [Exilibacterium tricleocarpae]|uniref:Peptidase C14 n=1 Tax=Exilibacterium tricleocarpae TaxID=2591008 RepID=A0A545U3H8_9GAMM|nr:caspase family protein [Exilibacterium tricleocarpae]TQV84030.1 peptidase C14 [Exilibacterium tricleocarpae]
MRRLLNRADNDLVCKSRRVLLAAGCALTGTLLASCTANAPTTAGAEPINPVADLHVVDCLLPGQVRMLGNTSYITPRRPTRTTAADCRTRGGEYVAYDRADYKTALSVWMPAADKGDAEAQTNVGEIFERGLGGEPNYEAALIWYRKAAEQGNTRAQYNLGTLYEQGHGVEKSQVEALNWYRKAWGLPPDNLIFQSAAAKAQSSLRADLQRQINQKDAQIKALQNQIERLQSKLQSQQVDTGVQEELQSLQDLVAQLENERRQNVQKVAALPKFRQPVKASATRTASLTGKALSAQGMNFGKYHALVIGNESYQMLDNLDTSRLDAQRAANLLRDKYGFSVRTLINADNIQVMKAINELNDLLTEEDNLVIFYAGHGSRVQTGDFVSGYWLPTNAEPPPTDTFWVSNEFVTRHLARMKAKRVLVVADSCYAGLLSSAPGYLFMGEDVQFNADYVRYKLPRRSRLLLSSGGDYPVLDNAGQGHSVFARALLDELESNDVVLSGPELFLRIRDRVKAGAAAIGVKQEPEFKAIKGAGHEVGDFFFVPQDGIASR